MKTFVIGISGVTNGGKTTLAKNLQKHFPNCSVISQDDFFKPESEIETDENGFLQYDVLEALNMEKMMSTISCWMENSRHPQGSTDSRSTEEVPMLIVEGFLLFNYNTRVYQPPDPPGYFDGHVWPMYLKHRLEMEDITWEIVYLDGTKSEEDLFSQVYEDLRQELAKQKYFPCPGHMALFAGASSCAPKGCGFDSQSGHVWEQLVSLSLSLLFLKVNKNISSVRV
ncbi:nicotinamide riboside kinase 1 isoform X2 [Artibeus jamaicensis]|uniref:nicotinamide riboside kinase 1 isoform X2 n=1 Tax=Artibeus jamaicensis TaxID=9417 RepID=UPI00235B22FA|nr:nicotinamide riboside kinase 1 isoform X2 [Artibeus jamaicensis]